MHGVGANERQMAAIAAHLDPRFLVLSVRSPLALGPEAYGWYRELPMGHEMSGESLEEVAGWLTAQLEAEVAA